MFTMVLEFADPPTMATPYSQRDSFRLTREPPEKWAIWVGQLAPKNRWRGTSNHFGWNSVPKIVPDTPSSHEAALSSDNDTQSTAFAVGVLFFSDLQHDGHRPARVRDFAVGRGQRAGGT